MASSICADRLDRYKALLTIKQTSLAVGSGLLWQNKKKKEELRRLAVASSKQSLLNIFLMKSTDFKWPIQEKK